VGIAEDPIAEQRHVIAQLGFSIQAAARVIQIDVPFAIQARIFCGT